MSLLLSSSLTFHFPFKLPSMSLSVLTFASFNSNSFFYLPSPSFVCLFLPLLTFSPPCMLLLAFPVPFPPLLTFASLYLPFLSYPSPCVYIKDIDPKMGSLMVVPGSHRNFVEGIGHGNVSCLIVA